MKKVIFVLVIFGILAEGYYVWSHREGNKSNLKYYFGMVPESYMSKEFVNDNVLTLSYWVKMNYPGTGAIQYYEESLKAKGWTPLEVNGLGLQRKWTYGIRVDPGTNVPACAFTYLAVWVNQPKDRLIQMTLVYYDPSPNKVCPPGPKNNELVVTLQELPCQS